MRIVIFGLAKTGTTALFYKLKSSLAPGTICLFEPASLDRGRPWRGRLWSALAGRAPPDVLVKLLPFGSRNPEVKSFATFDKQILIVRDPRDRLISHLLYDVYHLAFVGQDRQVSSFLELLRKKEAEPGSVSVRMLLATSAFLNGAPFRLEDWADGYRRRAIRMPLAFHDERPHLHIFRYEDMIDGYHEKLEDYLGMELTGSSDVDEQVNRVLRTKGYGAWRDWFTAEDIACFQAVLQPLLDRYYDGADWTLSAAPSISPHHCSGYVERLVNERRVIMKLPAYAGIG